MEYQKCRKRKERLMKGARLLFFFWVFLLSFSIIRYAILDLSDKLLGYSTDYEESYTIAENLDILQGINPEVWEKLDNLEKQAVLQTVANAEANYLGVKKPLKLKVATLDNDVLAKYNNRKHVIFIDQSHLQNDSIKDILTSVCHESYHAYQFSVAMAYASIDSSYKDLLLFQTPKLYLEEFKKYQNAEELSDYADYYNQKVERDAREYSESAVIDYYTKIKKKE